MPDDERQAALQQLRPLHLRLARLALRRYGVFDPGRIEDAAVAPEIRVWQGVYRPDPGRPYARWVARVIRNAAISDWREHHREQSGEGYVIPEGADGTEQLRQRLDLETPFSPADLTRIRAWHPLVRRIVVLAKSLLWRKVPGAEWSGWIGAFGLHDPFPPDGFEDLRERERNDELATGLVISRGSVNTHWFRGRPRLLELDYVRGLGDRRR